MTLSAKGQKLDRSKLYPEVNTDSRKVVHLKHNRTIAGQSRDARNEEGEDPYNPVLSTDPVRDHVDSDQEKMVDAPDKPVVAPLTASENHVLTACPRVKVMPEKVPTYFNERVKCLDRYNNEHESHSVNEHGTQTQTFGNVSRKSS